MNISRHLARKYARIFVRGHEKRTVFRERRSRKTVSSEEQIMSKDKYLSISSPQMEAIVFIILQIFFATRAIFKIGEYSRIFPSFSWGIFGHVTCLIIIIMQNLYSAISVSSIALYNNCNFKKRYI